jgi:hypothetical protein
VGGKWLAVGVTILASLIACTPESSDGPPAEGAQQTKSLEASVIHDFGVTGAAPQTKLTGVDAPSIDVGKGKLAILAVERPPVDAGCITAAQLRLYLQRHSPLAAGELAIYPSHVFNATEKEEGDEYGYSGSALDTRPRTTLDEATKGWTHWDVTDIVKRWLSRRPFPSQAVRVPRAMPIVLTLRDIDGAKPFATATFASADASENRPYLVIAHTEQCGAA